MRFWQRLTAHRDGGQPLPAEIYLSLVDALFKDSRSLFVGSLAASITALITAWKTGEQALYLCSVAIVIVACMRALDVQAYAARRPLLTTSEEARQWELRYVVGAAAHVSLMGIWCLVAFAKTSDPFVQIFSFSLTIAYMIGISGRNFASNLLVTAQIVCAGIPMTLALVSVGGAYYTIFAFVLVPFFASVKFISDRLRRVLLEAVVASRDVSLLAGRFDTALNNMPHGLCMFDGERRAAVSNKRLAELLGLSHSIADSRLAARELILSCVTAGTLSSANADRLAGWNSKAALPARSTASSSSRRSAAARSRSPSTPWPTAAASCCSRTSPTARWRKPRSTSSRATIRSPACPTARSSATRWTRP